MPPGLRARPPERSTCSCQPCTLSSPPLHPSPRPGPHLDLLLWMRLGGASASPISASAAALRSRLRTRLRPRLLWLRAALLAAAAARRGQGEGKQGAMGMSWAEGGGALALAACLDHSWHFARHHTCVYDTHQLWMQPGLGPPEPASHPSKPTQKDLRPTTASPPTQPHPHTLTKHTHATIKTPISHSSPHPPPAQLTTHPTSPHTPPHSQPPTAPRPTPSPPTRVQAHGPQLRLHALPGAGALRVHSPGYGRLVVARTLLAAVVCRREGGERREGYEDRAITTRNKHRLQHAK